MMSPSDNNQSLSATTTTEAETAISPESTNPFTINGDILSDPSKFVMSTLQLDDITCESSVPASFRLGKKPNGEVILQGSYTWQNLSKGIGGIKWREVPMVMLDEEGNELPG